MYSGPVYAETDLENGLCPWCVADGGAHAAFDATFVDPEGLDETVPPAVQAEICERTPGFASYQSERWLSCCGEPACFVAPAGASEIRTRFPRLEGELLGFIVHDMEISGGAARRLFDSLHRDRSPTAFVFQCRKCARSLAYVDGV